MRVPSLRLPEAKRGQHQIIKVVATLGLGADGSFVEDILCEREKIIGVRFEEIMFLFFCIQFYKS